MSKRIIALLVSGVMLLAMAAGCATRSASGDGGKPAAAGQDGATIDYQAMWAEGEPQSDWLKYVAAEYEAASSNKVNITFAGRDVLTKIKGRILTGDPPDIVDQDGSEIAAALLADEILLEPLDDLLNSKGLDGEAKLRDALSEEILSLYKKQGGIYFVPYNYITSGFFYDKKLFSKVGATAPKTWDEFIAAGEKFKAAGIPFLALDGSISFYNAYYYYWACQRVLGTGKFFEAATDKTGAAWDNPGFLKAAEMVYELSKGGKNFFQEGYEGSAFPQGQSDWALGNQGCVLCGSWLPTEVYDLVADDWEFGFFPFPTVSGGAGKVGEMEAYLIGWSIPKGAKNSEAAKDFLCFAINKKNSDAYVKMTNDMSSRLDASIPDVLSDVKPYLQASTDVFLSYDGVMGNAPQWWADVFYDLDDKLVFGQITPDEFISQIKAKTIEFYAKP